MHSMLNCTITLLSSTTLYVDIVSPDVSSPGSGVSSPGSGVSSPGSGVSSPGSGVSSFVMVKLVLAGAYTIFGGARLSKILLTVIVYVPAGSGDAKLILNTLGVSPPNSI